MVRKSKIKIHTTDQSKIWRSGSSFTIYLPVEVARIIRAPELHRGKVKLKLSLFKSGDDFIIEVRIPGGVS